MSLEEHHSLLGPGLRHALSSSRRFTRSQKPYISHFPCQFRPNGSPLLATTKTSHSVSTCQALIVYHSYNSQLLRQLIEVIPTVGNGSKASMLPVVSVLGSTRKRRPNYQKHHRHHGREPKMASKKLNGMTMQDGYSYGILIDPTCNGTSPVESS
jgi:hypothetical protein